MSTPAEPTELPQPLETTTTSMPEVVDHVAVARLYGEPLFSLPNDLYIPPMRWKCSWRPSRARWTCCST